MGSASALGEAVFVIDNASSRAASGAAEFSADAPDRSALVGSENDVMAGLSTAPQNNAPVLVDTPIIMPSVNEDAAGLGPGVLVSSLVDLNPPAGGQDNVTDADAGAVTGIAITAVDVDDGLLYYSLDGGGSWTLLFFAAPFNALLLPADANTRVYYQPAANFNGTVSSAFTFRAWDQTSGVAGAFVDVGTNGGTTAFSAATDTVSLVVSPVNDSPSLSASGALITDEQVAVRINPAMAVADADLDAYDGGLGDYAGAVFGINRISSGAPAEDQFGFDTTGALFTVSGSDLLAGGKIFAHIAFPSPGALNIQFNSSATIATRALVDDVLRHLTYTNTSNTPPASVTLGYALHDGSPGHGQGSGASAFSASQSVTVTINPLHDAPVLVDTAVVMPSVNEDSGFGPGVLVSSLVDLNPPVGGQDNVGEADGGTLIGIAITAVDVDDGVLYYSLDGGGSWTLLFFAAPFNALLLPADANTRVYYQPAANFNGTVSSAFTFRAWDQTSGVAGAFVDVGTNGGTTAFSAATDTVSLVVSPVNDSPSLSGSSPILVRSQVAVKINPAMTVADADLDVYDGGLGDYAGAVFGINRISSGAPAEDQYGFDTTGALFTVSGSDLLAGGKIFAHIAFPSPGALNIQFNSSATIATRALVDDVLRHLTYTNTSSTPPASVTLGYALHDGSPGHGQGSGASAFSASQSVTVTINDAPVLADALVKLAAENEDSPAPSGPVGSPVAKLVDLNPPAGDGLDNVSDADDNVTGIAVTAVDTAHGSLFYSTDNGASWSAVGALADNHALLLAADANTRLYFQPAANFNGSLPAAITFRAWDQSSGSAGSYADTSVSGGTSAFSSATDTASLVVTALNDTPVVSGTGPVATEEQVAVLLAPAIVISDADLDAYNGGLGDYGGSKLIANGSGSISPNDQFGIDTTGTSFTMSGNNLLLGGQIFANITIGTGVINIAFDSSATVVTRALVNEVAQHLLYTNASDTPPALVNIAYGLHDGSPLHGQGFGPAPTGFQVIAVTISPVNDAPVLADANVVLTALNEDGPAPSGAVGTLVSSLVDLNPPAGGLDNVTDADGILTGIALTGLDASHGSWFFSTDNGANWTAVGAVANGHALLLAADANSRLFFQPAPNFNGALAPAITFRAWDQTSGSNGGYFDAGINGGASAVSAATDTASLTINARNDTPIVSGTGPVTTQEQVAVLLAPAIVIADADLDAYNGGLGDYGGSKLIANGSSSINAEDQFGVDTTGTSFTMSGNNLLLGGHIFANITIGTGVINIAFDSTATVVTRALVNEVAQHLLYSRASDAPPALVNIVYGLHDGSPLHGQGFGPAPTGFQVIAVTINPVNDAPLLTDANVVLTAQNEDAGTPSGLVGTLVSSLIDFNPPASGLNNASDPDGNTLIGIAINAVDAAHGSLFYSTDNGGHWSAADPVSSTHSLLLAADANTRVYFQSSADLNGTLSSAITFHAWDQSSGSAGGYADVTSAGGSSAFSSATDTASLTINPVDDAPDLDTSIAATTYAEGTPGFVVDANLVLVDIDGPNLTGAVVAIGSGYVNGQDSLGFDTAFAAAHGIGATFNAATGELAFSGSAAVADYQTLLRSVTYSNNSDTPNTADRQIVFTASESAFYDPANGHFYQFVGPSEISWSSALAAAAGSSLYGLQGYLATITSAQEQSFIQSRVPGLGSWMGASDAGHEGDWRWATGPEGLANGGAGTPFWSGDSGGSAVAGAYTHWASLEPNNNNNIENYGLIASGGGWNDVPESFNITRYIVEYGDMPGDPVLDLSGTVTVHVQAVNDAPVVTAPASVSGTEDVAFNLSGISASDPDVGSADLVVSLSVNHGNLTLSNFSGFSLGAGGSLAIAAANLNLLLAGIRYTPDPDFNGNDSLTVSVSDQGATGAGGEQSDTKTVAIHLDAVNDAPVVINGAIATLPAILEDAGNPPGDTIANLFGGHFSDAADEQSAFGGSAAGGINGIVVTANGSSAATGRWQYLSDSAGAAWTDIGSATITTAKLFLATAKLRFLPAADYNGPAPALVAHLVDGSVSFGDANSTNVNGFTGGSKPYSVDAVTLGTTIVSVNDAPLLYSTGTAHGFMENGAPVALVDAVTVSDIESSHFPGGTLSISATNGQPDDGLVILTDLGLAVDLAAGTIAYNSQLIANITGPGQVTFTANADAAAVSVLIRSLAYTNGSDDPTGGTRQVLITFTDGGGTDNGGHDSATISAMVNVIPVNDPPAWSEIGSDSSFATVTETNGELSKSGTLTVNDPELADSVTVAVDSVAKAGLGPDGTLNFTASLTDMLRLPGGAIAANPGDQHNVGWTFDSGTETFDYLAKNQAIILSFVLKAKDGSNATGLGEVDIVVTGTNDAPILTGALGSDVTIAEDGGSYSASGVTGFRDYDLSDSHVLAIGSVTPTITHSPTVPGGRIPANGFSSAIGMTVSGSVGSNTVENTTDTSDAFNVRWDYSVSNAQIQGLAAGEWVTQVYHQTVVDPWGASATKDITITLTGVNDGPSLTVGAGDSAAATITETNATLAASGTLTATDPDWSDTLAAAIFSVAKSGNVGGLVPPDSALMGMLSVPASLAAEPEDRNNLGWTFNSGSATFDYLAAGEHLDLTYTIMVDDGHLGTAARQVVVTINGSNDAPVIDLVTTDSVASALAETNTGLVGAGTLTVVDPDLTDSVTASVGTVLTHGATNGLASGSGQLQAMFSVSVGSIAADAGTTHNLAWNFASGLEAFNYLADGASLILTYPVTVTDQSGVTATRNVVITITGTNDVPWLDAVAGIGYADTANDDIFLPIGGTLLSSEADVGDTLAYSITGGGADSSLSGFDQSSSAGGYGTLYLDSATGAYLFVPNDLAIEGLKSSSSASFVLNVADNHGATASRTLVVSLSGANDSPVLDAVPHLIVTDTANDDAFAPIIGSLASSDRDFLDLPSYSALGQHADTSRPGFDRSVANAFGTLYLDSTSGAYAFIPDDAAVEGLKADVSAAFQVIVTDGSGATATQNLVIDIHGVNDTPDASIGAGDSAGSTIIETNSGLSAAGSISVADRDVPETVTATVLTVVKTGTVVGLGPSDTALMAMFNGPAGPVAAGPGATHNVAWSFNSGGEAFNYLDDGESLTLDYGIQVTDSSGATDIQNVTITINGTNDAPMVSLVTTDSTSLDLLEGNGGLTGNGTLTAVDPDRSDSASVSISGLTKSGVTGGLVPSDAQLLAMLHLPVTLPADPGSAHNLAWSFDSAGEAFNYLHTGEVLTLGYTVQVADDNGVTSSRLVTVTITGTNDAPIISPSTVATGHVTELPDHSAGENVATLTASGAIDFTDGDIADLHGATLVAQRGSYLGSFATNLTEANGVGSVGWSFSVSDAALNNLGQGQVLQQFYKVTIEDGHGGSVDQMVEVDLHGTNDAAILSSANVFVEQGAAPATASGTLTISDEDDPALFMPQSSTPGLHGHLSVDAAGHWSYLADAAYTLGAGQFLTDVFTVLAVDGTPTNVAVTITGHDTPAAAHPDLFTTDEATMVGAGLSLFADNGAGADLDPDTPLQVAAVNGVAANVGHSLLLASGARVLVNADGTFRYDPNHAFDWLTPAVAAANRFGSDSFTYTLAGGSSATVHVGISGVNSPGDVILGSGVNDVITAFDTNDSFRLQQGGSDTALGLGGNDGFYFGAALDPGDQVDGGGGNDTVAVQGNTHVVLGDIFNVEVLALLSGSDTRFGEPGGSRYGYDITTNDGNVAPGGTLTVIGTGLLPGENLTFDGSAESDGNFRIFAGQGIDHLTAGAGSDGFFFGADGNLTGADRIDGGPGIDSIALRGNYVGVTALMFQDASFTNVEVLALLSGHSNEYGGVIVPAGFDYDLTLANGNVAAGQRLDVIATSLAADESLRFDGSAESDGSYRILSGAGDDRIVGGSGSDMIYGGRGADHLAGGAGADIFVYLAAAESTSTGYDTIAGFDYHEDRIDVPGGGSRAFGQAGIGSLSTASFDSDLALGLSGVLGAGQAALFTANAGSLSGHVFAVIDANGIAGYQAGQDFVIELIDPVVPIDPHAGVIL